MVRSQTDEKLKLLIGCIYRSPNSNVTNDAKINGTLKNAKKSRFLACTDIW